MAELVTIRHKQTQRERQVSKSAVPFFPDYEVVSAKASSKTNEKG